MKVLALAADNGGCGFYRLRAPAEEAKKLGVDITVQSEISADAVKYPQTQMVEVREVHTDADLIIVQRPLDNALTAVIKQAQKQGIATVVELDDDFSTVARGNVAYDAMFGQKHTGSHWVETAASIADHVTVSTPQLLKFARHGRGSVLRNCVPDSIFSVDGPKSKGQEWPRIGWTGTVQTHPHDLQQTKGAVAEVLYKNGLPMNVVGDGDMVANYMRLHPDTEVFASGWIDLDDYYKYVHAFLDIGIVPLEPSSFNEAKSYLKGLEYAALGIPFVASPTKEYERLAAHGIGKVAKTPGDWRKHLQKMIDRPSSTEREAKEARDRIEAEHTYSTNANQWVEAWEKAIHYRKTHHEQEATG